jgi:hypothetical protein
MENNSNKSNLLNELRIASPCPMLWEEMQLTEEEAVRFCGECRKNVYDVASMSESEAKLLLQKAAAAGQGRVCLQLYRRADGTVITDDCPVGLKRVRNVYRRLKAACAAFASLWAANNLPAFAQVADGKPDSDRVRALRGEVCPPSMPAYPGGMRPPGIEEWRVEALTHKSIKQALDKLEAGLKNPKIAKADQAKLSLAVAQESIKEKLPLFAREYLIRAENLLAGTAGNGRLLKQILQTQLKTARSLGEETQVIEKKLMNLKGDRY